MAAGQVNKWLGGDSGNETDAAVTANWSLGTIPVDGEIIVFDDTANEDEDSRKYDCLFTNWITGVLITRGVKVDSTFDADIGDTTDIWEITCEDSGTEYDFIYEGSGNCYVKLKDNSTDYACKRLIVYSEGGLFIYSDDGGEGTRNNTWNDVIVYAGSLTIADDTVLESITVLAGTVIVGKNCKDTAGNDVDVVHIGGNTYWDSELGAIVEIYGGSFYFGSAGNLGDTDALEADLVKVFGGTFFWRVQPSAGTSVVKQFEVHPAGTFDASLAAGAAGPKQIGSGAGEISEVFYGGTVKLNNGCGNISLGSGSKIYSRGGTLVLPDDEEVSW